MAATQLGVIKTQSPEGNTAITSEGVTHTITKTMPVDEAYDINTHTQATFPIEIMDSTLYIQSINIDRQPGQIAQVTYNYKSSAGVFPVGGVTGPGGVVGPQPSARNLPRYEYDAVVEPVSILRLDKFSRLSRDDLRVLTTMIQSGPMDSDGNAIRRFLSGDTNAEECADLIEDGVVSKLAPSLIVRITHTDKSWGQAPVGAAKLGDLSSPDSLLAGSGLFDFILTGISASGTADGMDTFTETHQSAPFLDNWDRRIYES
jgi:hypothetical protein